ncbi:DUF928 domain-containing protein [Leptothoe sp. PORK10 BA2]|uniref:DUF928 domain-containing protein n=1 Tax=Leptothoe sp. PORK10 BA2 TaxID=3110254 RepID=UPI002B21BEA3|nr:DUF928 domain-containing protein [Leptothoe sp. PORK10 BA2]
MFLTGLALGLGSPAQARRLFPSMPSVHPAIYPPIHPAVLLSGPPQDIGYPRRGTRRGGGSRGGVCDLPPDVSPLTALMPDTATWTGGDQTIAQTDESSGEIVFSFTHRASPDLWFYQPYGLVEDSRVEFTLKDGAGNTISRSRLDTTDAMATVPGIMRVSLNDVGLTLMANTDYHWYLTVHCAAGPPIVVDGWINYQPLEGDALPQPPQQFLVDHLSVLAEAQFSQPGPGSGNSSSHGFGQADWQGLLESIGLGDITAIPRIDCCRFVTQPQN